MARTHASRRKRIVLYAAWGLCLPASLVAATALYYMVSFSREIDARLRGEQDERSQPRIFARPFTLRTGQALSMDDLVDRLNDLGYAEKPTVANPAEFAVDNGRATIGIRGGDRDGQSIRVSIARTGGGRGTVSRIERLPRGRLDLVTLEPPLLTALASSGREKRRTRPLADIPDVMVQAVLAIEDRRFFDHPGVDLVRTVAAIVTNLTGDRPYLVGGSTLTQQLVKNFFLSPEKTIKRKVLEQLMALVLERRLSKDQILELYLNEVYLGQRGSFAIHGVAEGARMFYGKDIANITLAEAATMAGIIQSPQAYSPVRAPERSKTRRNVVLRTMVESGFITTELFETAALEPIVTIPQALDNEAPYFVDMVGQVLADHYADLPAARGVDVYTTLDLHLQRLAQEAIREGLARVDATGAARRSPVPPQAALVAIDPGTGEVLALVGGRAYSQSQYNRVTTAKRQPGSVVKPFVFLAAFEQGLADGRTDLTPASLVLDEPTTFYYEDKEWVPANYGDEYDGIASFRQALAHSRNVGTIKVAETIGFDAVARLWSRLNTATKPQAYPSIALGVFEVTPLEIAEAYTLFPSLGLVRPLSVVRDIRVDGRGVEVRARAEPRQVTDARTTFLVTNMMRSVMNEGTGAAARGMGFSLDAAGKSGTTNDLRDAWFVGFTPELLTVVWVGFDDNRPLGLTGSQAALPIWTTFMNRALAGTPNRPFEAPDGVNWTRIDPDTGSLAAPGCPRVIDEAFLPGTEPTDVCVLHSYPSH